MFHSAVVVFGILEDMVEGREDSGHLSVTITRNVSTAAPISFTFTPTEYDDTLGFEIPSFDPNSPSTATCEPFYSM